MRVLVSILIFLGSVDPLFGCASCGSGGGEPLILYPNETIKSYFGLGFHSGFRNVNSSGDVRRSTGPEKKYSATFSVGYRASLNGFFTATVPYLINVKNNDERKRVGDPSLAYRYTLVPMNFTRPTIPQVQVLFGYKKSRGASMAENPTAIDVFGNGSNEKRVGLDLWTGMAPIQTGLNLLRTYYDEFSANGMTHKLGVSDQVTASLGSIFGSYKGSLGLIRKNRRPLTMNSVVISNSDQMQKDAYITIETRRPTDNFRLTYLRQGSWGALKNGVQSTKAVVAYMRTFR